MKNIIRWFILNTVAANLLMVFIIIAGIFTLSRLRMEVFPDITIPIINVSVVYPGASPEDVEESICVKVEEQVQGINGLKRITSSSNEGYGSINIEVENGYDIDEVKDVLKEIALNNSNVLKDPEPRVRFRKFSSSGLKLQLLFWIYKPAIRGRTVDAVNTDIYKTFSKRKIIIPFPTVNLITKDT